VETIKRQTRAAHGCLVTGQSPWAQAWTVAYSLFTRSVCLRACIPLERKLDEICTFDSVLVLTETKTSTNNGAGN